MRSRNLNVAGAGAVLALLAVLPAAAADKPQITVVEHTLSNGMRWLLYENHDSPTIAAGWTARVGSANERPGITGISHFFEHMMFKGTKTIGTKDIDEDLRLIEEQEKLRDGMRAEMEVMRERLRRGEIDDLQKPENWTDRYRELDKQFDALVRKQREITLKDQMDQIYTKNGGEFLNAFTSEDQTAYFVRIPSNRLELWAWLESDRLLNPVFREFYSERDVVFEERRLAVESTPLGKYDEAFNALFWEASPYNWPVVGWASDIPMYTLAQAKQYFATYYAPNNLTGVLAGDFKAAEVKPILERYFGRIPRGTVEPPAGRHPGTEAARREALQRGGRDLPHRADLVEDGPLPPQGHPRPRPPLRRAVRADGPAPQGPRPRPAGRERVLRVDRAAQARRDLHGRDHGQGRQGAGGGRGRGVRGDREAAEESPCPPRSCRRSRTPSRPTPTGGSRTRSRSSSSS